MIDAIELAVTNQVIECLEGKIGVDGPGAVTQQQRHVMCLAWFAGFNDETDLHACAHTHEMMVHAGDSQQRRHRYVVLVYVPVGQYNEGITLGDRCTCLPAQIRERAR